MSIVNRDAESSINHRRFPNNTPRSLLLLLQHPQSIARFRIIIIGTVKLSDIFVPDPLVLNVVYCGDDGIAIFIYGVDLPIVLSPELLSRFFKS